MKTTTRDTEIMRHIADLYRRLAIANIELAEVQREMIDRYSVWDIGRSVNASKRLDAQSVMMKKQADDYEMGSHA